MENTTERWLPVVGFEGFYEVSDLGRVRRVARGKSTLPGRLRNDRPSRRHGYRIINLSKGSRESQVPLRVHRLVLEAFVGPCPPGQECLHGDGDRANAALSNLRWGTRKENGADTRRHGTAPRGERAARAKLSALKVRALRALAAQGVRLRRLAPLFGIGEQAVGKVVNGQRWAHVPQEVAPCP